MYVPVNSLDLWALPRFQEGIGNPGVCRTYIDTYNEAFLRPTMGLEGSCRHGVRGRLVLGLLMGIRFRDETAVLHRHIGGKNGGDSWALRRIENGAAVT